MTAGSCTLTRERDDVCQLDDYCKLTGKSEVIFGDVDRDDFVSACVEWNLRSEWRKGLQYETKVPWYEGLWRDDALWREAGVWLVRLAAVLVLAMSSSSHFLKGDLCSAKKCTEQIHHPHGWVDLPNPINEVSAEKLYVHYVHVRKQAKRRYFCPQVRFLIFSTTPTTNCSCWPRSRSSSFHDDEKKFCSDSTDKTNWFGAGHSEPVISDVFVTTTAFL